MRRGRRKCRVGETVVSGRRERWRMERQTRARRREGRVRAKREEAKEDLKAKNKICGRSTLRGSEKEKGKEREC